MRLNLFDIFSASLEMVVKSVIEMICYVMI